MSVPTTDHSSHAYLWTEPFLDSMRSVTDPEPDQIAAEVYKEGGVGALLTLKKFTDHWDAPITDALPPRVRAWFEAPVDYPSWVDFDKVKIVEDAFIQHGPVAVVVLLNTGVPHFFTNPAGARSFCLAKIFSPNSVNTRMHEVPQFVINVTERGGLKEYAGADGRVRKGNGILTVQKLRFAHACIRIRLKMKQRFPEDDWDVKTLGEPINQEDMAQAVLDFCLATMDGLERLGIRWTPEWREASLHFWKVVGFLLGLREELQPKDMNEARQLYAIIRRRQAHASDAGKEIVSEMLGVMEGLLPSLFRRLPAALMHYVAGDEVAGMLGLPPRPILLFLLRATGPFWRDTGMVRWMAERMSPRVIAWMLRKDIRAERGGLSIPGYLQEAWGLTAALRGRIPQDGLASSDFRR